MITLPAVLLVYDRTFLAADWRTVLRRDGRHLGLIAAGCWVLPVFVHLVVHGAADDAAAAVGAGARRLAGNVPPDAVDGVAALSPPQRLAERSELRVSRLDRVSRMDRRSGRICSASALALAVTAYGVVPRPLVRVPRHMVLRDPVADVAGADRRFRRGVSDVSAAGRPSSPGSCSAAIGCCRSCRMRALRRAIAIVLVVGVAFGSRRAHLAAERRLCDGDITLWMRNLETRPDDAKAYMLPGDRPRGRGAIRGGGAAVSDRDPPGVHAVSCRTPRSA